jgi:DivIVA domain-containing protein
MTRGPGEPAGKPATGAKITPLDIQQKEFRVSRFGGYRMRDVDEFLDKLTEVVSGLVDENARLRRQSGAAPVVGSPDLDDVARQADEIIQRARDEAARVAAEARARATAPASGTDEDRAAVKVFLNQERAFLQELAGLVQGHAETVKGMAKSARRPEVPDTLATEPVPEPPSAPDASAAAAPAAAPPAQEAEEPAAGGNDDGSTDRVVEIGDADATQSLPPPDERTELAQTRPTAGQERTNEGDPSLRELFWGEEG